MTVSATLGVVRAAERRLAPAALPRLDTTPLLTIEHRVLPRSIQAGEARFSDLPDYYWEQNPDIKARFHQARRVYEAKSQVPYRAMTLVSGAAGIGKTFIKGEIFDKGYPQEDVCKFDLRELYTEWREAGRAEERPDLHAGRVVLNSQLALRPDQPRLLRDYLQSQKASFYVVDSIDEIHPDEWERVLRELEEFVFLGGHDFIHVVVLGRGGALREFWHSRSGFYSRDQLELCVLNPPIFRTTGDLLVSSWNYHCWKFKLQWSRGGGAFEPMPFQAYCEWVESGFPASASDYQVRCEPNQCMNRRVHETLLSWASTSPVVNSTLYNLAGNGMLREIAEESALADRPWSEAGITELYLQRWLERDTKSTGRPSEAKPEYLDLYKRLLEAVAVKYLQEARMDGDGHFTVNYSDAITVEYQGQLLRFPVFRILDGSGLINLDPREPGSRRYRFEPAWIHRSLVTGHNRRLTEAFVTSRQLVSGS